MEFAPTVPYFRINLAAVLGQLGRLEEALLHLQAAARHATNLPELHNNMGVTLEKLGRLREADKAFREAIRLRSEFAEAQFNLGNVLRKQGLCRAAISQYQEAARLRPNYRKPYDALGSCWTELGGIEEAIACFRRIVEIVPDDPAALSALLYTLHYDPNYDTASLAEEHRKWGRRFGGISTKESKQHRNDKVGGRRLRIGYVSPDFREHTPPRFIGAAFRHHDRSQFEVHCYSDVQKPDAITEKLKGMIEHWHDIVGWTDERDGLPDHRCVPGFIRRNRATSY